MSKRHIVQAYEFTSAPIAKALMEAHRRSVKVQVNRATHYSPPRQCLQPAACPCLRTVSSSPLARKCHDALPLHA